MNTHHILLCLVAMTLPPIAAHASPKFDPAPSIMPRLTLGEYARLSGAVQDNSGLEYLRILVNDRAIGHYPLHGATTWSLLNYRFSTRPDANPQDENEPVTFMGTLERYAQRPGIYKIALLVGNQKGEATRSDALSIEVIARPPFYLTSPLGSLDTLGVQPHEKGKITSIFDHDQSRSYSKNRRIMSFQGIAGAASTPDELGCQAVCRYNADEAPAFETHYGSYNESALWYDDHPALDYSAPIGTPVYAPADGVVKSISGDGNNTFTVDHDFGYSSRYLHCSRISVAAGDKVRRGDLIALSGGDQPHLHFEVLKDGVAVDPYGWEGPGIDPYYSMGGYIEAKRNIQIWAGDPILVPLDTNRLRILGYGFGKETRDDSGALGIEDFINGISLAAQIKAWEPNRVEIESSLDFNWIEHDTNRRPLIIRIVPPSRTGLGPQVVYYPFSDVAYDKKVWYWPYVIYLWQEGIIKGLSSTGSSYFAPGWQISRAEFIAMLVRSIETREAIYPTSSAAIPSASEKDWFIKDGSLIKAYSYRNPNNNQESIAFWVGTPPESSPGSAWSDNVTRGEAAHLLANALRLAPYGGTPPDDSPFSDIAVASEVAKWAIALKRAGVIDGYPDGSFRPSGLLNRAEAAKVLFTAFFQPYDPFAIAALQRSLDNL